LGDGGEKSASPSSSTPPGRPWICRRRAPYSFRTVRDQIARGPCPATAGHGVRSPHPTAVRWSVGVFPRTCCFLGRRLQPLLRCLWSAGAGASPTPSTTGGPRRVALQLNARLLPRANRRRNIGRPGLGDGHACLLRTRLGPPGVGPDQQTLAGFVASYTATK